MFRKYNVVASGPDSSRRKNIFRRPRFSRQSVSGLPSITKKKKTEAIATRTKAKLSPNTLPCTLPFKTHETKTLSMHTSVRQQNAFPRGRGHEDNITCTLHHPYTYTHADETDDDEDEDEDDGRDDASDTFSQKRMTDAGQQRNDAETDDTNDDDDDTDNDDDNEEENEEEEEEEEKEKAESDNKHHVEPPAKSIWNVVLELVLPILKHEQDSKDNNQDEDDTDDDDDDDEEDDEEEMMELVCGFDVALGREMCRPWLRPDRPWHAAPWVSQQA
jgi:hypothetical protein